MKIRRLLTLLLATVFAAGAFAACEREAEVTTEEPQEQRQEQLEEQAEERDRIEQVADNPTAMLGQQVDLVGEVETVHGPNAFTLEEEGQITDDNLLVIVPQNVSTQGMLEQGKYVKVSGTVREASVIEIERDYGWDISPELEAEFEGTVPFVVADRVTL